MGKLFSFVSLIIVVAAGAYIFMRQARSGMSAGTSTPTPTVDIVGVKNDLLAIAQAERAHGALQGGFVSIDELRSQGELSMSRYNRGAYTYSAEVKGGSFRIVATYSGPDPGMPKTISINETMQISQQ